MHELSIVESLLSIVRETMKDYGGRRLCSVGIRVGTLAGVEPDIMSFCFEAATRGSDLEGVRLEITSVPVFGTCSGCGEKVEVDNFVLLCPSCGFPLAIEGGRELEITHLEIE